ncbi:MAG: PEP-CTERM motif protein [Armatimonadetes bacterium OLB18]|nr:MAG: PEP-CTERM motif protein [Armatimonadetes bacterium OLB18]
MLKHRALLISSLAVASSFAAAAVIYDNGGIVTHPAGGFGGADASSLQTGLGNNIYGYGAQVSAGNWMADDFTIGAGDQWTIDTFDFMAYQTGSTTTSTINDLRVVIFNAQPAGTGFGAPAFGSTATNVLGSTAWSGIYRVIDTNLLATNRPVMDVQSSNLGWVLGPGTYWVAWQFGGTLSSGPWQPPVTILGQNNKPGSNAMQFTTSGWANAVDSGTFTGPHDMPFAINGTAVPEPATMAILGAGFAFLARRRRK